MKKEKIRIAALVTNGNYKWCWGTSVEKVIKILDVKEKFTFDTYTSFSLQELKRILDFNPHILWSRGPASQSWIINLVRALEKNNKKPCLISTITTGGDSLFDRIEREKNFSKNIHCFIVQNEDAKLRLGYALSGKTKFTFKIPSGVDTKFFKPIQVVRDKAFTVGIAGRATTKEWAQLKGYPLIANACWILNIPLLESHTRSHEKMPEFYNSIDCLVVASHSEGCSNVAMEAMACGVPVISTKVGFHGEECVDNENIIFVSRTVPDILAKIKSLRDNKHLRDKLSENSLLFAKKYDIINIANMYDIVFCSIIEMLKLKEK